MVQTICLTIRNTEVQMSMEKPLENSCLCVVGLGYVGLPLALEFAKVMRVIGFDIDSAKLDMYRAGHDPTGEIVNNELLNSTATLTSDPQMLKTPDYFIVTVPTPVDEANDPDFRPLIAASKTIGAHMKRGAVVIYESTVYPGATEEVCVRELEAASGLVWKKDFFVGYSPERINPGDSEHTLSAIVKVVAGDTTETLARVVKLYSQVVRAGVFPASSIRVAEAAKVIENTQRDLNIALMNELALIFHRMDIDTNEVLAAAGTKWNFLRFKPGLVGGHCIGVDPYYLTHKAETLGYHPEVILAGRRINDGMGKYVAEQTIKMMIAEGVGVKDADVTILGMSFKENCADTRNSKVWSIIRELREFGVNVHVHDPLASPDEVLKEYGVTLRSWNELPPSSHAVILAVAHREYVSMGVSGICEKLGKVGCFIDVKGVLNVEEVRSRGIALWRL